MCITWPKVCNQKVMEKVTKRNLLLLLCMGRQLIHETLLASKRELLFKQFNFISKLGSRRKRKEGKLFLWLSSRKIMLNCDRRNHEFLRSARCGASKQFRWCQTIYLVSGFSYTHMHKHIHMLTPAPHRLSFLYFFLAFFPVVFVYIYYTYNL